MNTMIKKLGSANKTNVLNLADFLLSQVMGIERGSDRCGYGIPILHA